MATRKPAFVGFRGDNIAADVAVAACVPGTIGLVLMGYSVRENKAVGAVAAGRIMAGEVAAGKPLAFIELAVDAGQTIWLGDGIAIGNEGISIDHEAGEFDLVLYIAA